MLIPSLAIPRAPHAIGHTLPEVKRIVKGFTHMQAIEVRLSIQIRHKPAVALVLHHSDYLGFSAFHGCA